MTDTDESEPSGSNRASPGQPLFIDFLYFEDCPSHERALTLLRDVVQREQIEAEVHIRKVETDQQAEELRFPGSPTIRVNGQDIDQDHASTIGLSCRIYHRADGRMTPLPPDETIAGALRRAARSVEVQDLGNVAPLAVSQQVEGR